MSKLAGKVALVTGGGRGQGRSHAITLAAAGADVAICDIVEQDPLVPYPTGRPGDLEETARLIDGMGRRCLARVVDVSDFSELSSFIEAVRTDLGAVDILVVNHGISIDGPIQSLTREQWRKVVEVDLTGVFNAVRLVVPMMIEKNAGHIVATSSFAAHGRAVPNMSNYIAAKWGVIGFVKSVALDLEPYGIAVNTICPSTADTELFRNEAMRRLFCPDLDDPSDADFDQRIRELGWTLLQPAEISNALMSLVSLDPDAAKKLSGEAIDVQPGKVTCETTYGDQLLGSA